MKVELVGSFSPKVLLDGVEARHVTRIRIDASTDRVVTCDLEFLNLDGMTTIGEADVQYIAYARSAVRPEGGNRRKCCGCSPTRWK